MSNSVTASSNPVVRTLDDLLAECKGLSVEELSGRKLQQWLLQATLSSEVEKLYEYLLDNSVPMRVIIPEIKRATPELAKRSLDHCIEQHRRYQQNRHVERQDTVLRGSFQSRLVPRFSSKDLSLA